jgi:hypothetical protein
MAAASLAFVSSAVSAFGGLRSRRNTPVYICGSKFRPARVVRQRSTLRCCSESGFEGSGGDIGEYSGGDYGGGSATHASDSSGNDGVDPAVDPDGVNSRLTLSFGADGSVESSGGDKTQAADARSGTADADASAATANFDDVYEKPGIGEMGHNPSTNYNIYDGPLDAIDATNFTFGASNKLTERDMILGNFVNVPSVGKEGDVKMFYRQSLPLTGTYDSSTAVLLLSGIPASSYSWRDVLPVVSKKAGLRAIAPDWLGFGFSDKTAPGYGFSYSTNDYVNSIGEFLKAVCVTRVACVVSQGWLATNGLLFALRNTGMVDSVYIVNSPLPPVRPKRPFSIAKWALFGFFGEGFAQDALSIEKCIEGKLACTFAPDCVV